MPRRYCLRCNIELSMHGSSIFSTAVQKSTHTRQVTMVQYLHMAKRGQEKPTPSWVRKAATTRLTSEACYRACSSIYSIPLMHKPQALMMVVKSATAAAARVWVSAVRLFPFCLPVGRSVFFFLNLRKYDIHANCAASF